MGDFAALRAEFPVLERLSYLNAGTNGPVPRRALEAARESLREQSERGRGDAAFFESAIGAAEKLRAHVARIMGCTTAELALTGSTTDGVNLVVSGLDLGASGEVLTSDEEHPGVLAPLAALRERRGVRIRVAPFEAIAGEVRADTRLVACSHVSWISGRVVDAAALAASAAPVLLDGAQGLGAIALDVGDLGCDFYAASGQKWLCGPNGIGYLHVRPERLDGLSVAWPWFGTVKDPHHPLDFDLQDEARRLDMGILAPHDVAWAGAAIDTLATPGLDRVYDRATGLAARLAELLAERGRVVAARGESTLVSWETADPEAETERLAKEGVVVRNLPEHPYVRASVGAWSTEDELERLADLVGMV